MERKRELKTLVQQHIIIDGGGVIVQMYPEQVYALPVETT